MRSGGLQYILNHTYPAKSPVDFVLSRRIDILKNEPKANRIGQLVLISRPEL